MKTRRYITLLALFALSSCVTNQLIFQEKKINDFDKLDIRTVIKLEKQKKSKEITPSHLIRIGEAIYPNKNKYDLATPKTYEIIEKPHFRFQTSYYYTVNDSLVKVILYKWDYLQNNIIDFYDNEENRIKRFKAFQTKFDNLTSQLTHEFGEPILKNFGQVRNNDNNFRDDYMFKRADGLNAYLFMFGNTLRLIIYKD